ncbi:MAG: hypothetical protein J5890_02785 [Clostridia bacterium]|nr:hypothetical protein [Clostridia bacterium]MBR5713691.1 hypothetical protein [Clostridia bacterium]MBR5719251.1 hypothetical protein [Clostridia bacterium]
MNDPDKKVKDGHVDLEDEELPIEKKDLLAMTISGFLVIGIPCLILILLITAVVLLLFAR